MSSKERFTKPKNANTAQLLQRAQELLQRKRKNEAAELYRHVLKTEPANYFALFNLGKILHEQRELDEAASCFEKILVSRKGDAQAQVALAFVQIDRQDIDAALKTWSETKATSPKLLVKFGTHLRMAGRLAEAEKFFEEAVAADASCILAYQGLSLLKKLPADSKHLARMLELEKKGANLPIEDRILLGFTLGNVFLDQGDGDNAFPRLEEANKLKRRGTKYDIGLFERYVDNILTLTGRDFAARENSGVKDDSPIFIVGMMRSGSTLTDQILSAHPDVANLGESDFLPRSLPYFANAEIPGLFQAGVTSVTKPLLDSLDVAGLKGIAEKYLLLSAPIRGKATRDVDKMLFNDLWLGVIRLALPQARVVHCTRDPIDTGLSIWRISFNDNIPWAYDMRDIGRYYNAHMKLMRHWKGLFPGWIFEANYETLVAHQEEASRKLVDHCGLPWNDACLNFHESARRVVTASATQVRQPLYKSAAGKWRRYEKFLSPLIEAVEAGKKP